LFKIARMKLFLPTLFLLQALMTSAQVGDIKNASSRNSGSSSSSGGSRGGDRGSSVGSGAFLYFFVDAMSGLAQWQQYKLQKKNINPYIVSFDIVAQAALQPSRYYLFNPRIRGNWGLFSTDFRVNYLLEENVLGPQDLSSIDWQVLQLNIVTTRHVIGRIGGGFMKENFGGRQSFFESTYGVFVQSNNKNIGVSAEYRLAQDFVTGAIPRRELSAQFEKRLFSSGYWNTYLTLGGVYQRYYESISVWGLQAGLAFRVFSPPAQSEF
jgi:hypothetical protein